MEQDPISEGEVLRQIEFTKKAVQENKSNLYEHIYKVMDVFSRVALDFLHKKDDWKTAKDEEGNPMWSEEQASSIESLLPDAIQKGGGGELFQLHSDSKFIAPEKTQEISLDGMMKSVKQFLATIDEKNREVAREIGPVAYINKMGADPGFGPAPPYLPFRLQLPAGAILPLINYLLESCRLLVITNKYDNPTLRKILSVVLAILDVSRGEWRNGILSLLGVFSRETLLTGVVLKTARFIYSWISPDIQQSIETGLYSASKSMFIGGWLWLLSVVAPDYLRVTLNKLIDKTKIDEGTEEDTELEQIVVGEGAKHGASVKLPKPTDILNFSDIQNFQVLLHMPEITCNPRFQARIQPLIEVPPFRIILELLNVPTSKEDVARVCESNRTV